MRKENKTILALYPNQLGIGYALFDSPKELVQYGVSYVQPISNTLVLSRVKKYITYYKPDIIITRSSDSHKNSKRIERVIKRICKEALKQQLEVYDYSRTDIKEVFSQHDANSKYQVSKVLMSTFPKLEIYGYQKPKRWMSENHNAGLFDAVSLAITHFYMTT